MSDPVNKAYFPGRIRRIAQDDPQQGQTPGKGTLISGQAPIGPSPSPKAQLPRLTLSGGNRQLVQPEPHKYRTGNQFADDGMACDESGSNECFLDPAQRQRIVGLYQGRVLAAQAAYIAALEELRVEELLKKQKESPSWLLDLFIEVIGLVTISSVTRVFKHFRDAGGDDLVSILSSDAARGVALAEMQKSSERTVETFVKSAVTLGKKQVPKQSPQPDSEKAINVSYLDSLTHQSAAVFQGLRENALATLKTDALLLVMWESFDSTMGHTTDEYKQELKAKLERFDNSAVSKIGVQRTPGYISPTTQRIRPEALTDFRQTDAKAWWQKSDSGRLRLGIWQRGHTDTTPMPWGTPDANFGDEFFVEWVPDEFVETAIQLHTAKWGSPPSHRLGDYWPWMGKQK